MANLTIKRGDTWTRTATLYNPTGSAYDLTGCTVWWTLKDQSDNRSDDTEAVAKLYWISGGASSGITVAAPTSGAISVALTAVQTAALEAGKSYKFDVQVKKANGDIETAGEGFAMVEGDVTIRTTTP